MWQRITERSELSFSTAATAGPGVDIDGHRVSGSPVQLGETVGMGRVADMGRKKDVVLPAPGWAMIVPFASVHGQGVMLTLYVEHRA